MSDPRDPPTVWLSPTATVRAVSHPGSDLVRLTVTDGDAAVCLVLNGAQAEQACEQIVGSRPWSPAWWEVYGR